MSISPRLHVTIFVSRFVLAGVVCWISVPNEFVITPGFAGVHPVESVSVTVALDAAAHPLL